MKRMKCVGAVGLAAVVGLSGCRTAEEPALPKEVEVHVIEIEVDSEWLSAAFSNRVWATDATHLEPATSSGDPARYVGVKRRAHAAFLVDFEEADALYYDARPMSDALEEIIRNPRGTATVISSRRLAVGARVLDDQTKIVEMPVDFEVVDGSVVATAKESVKIGRSIYARLEAITATRTFFWIYAYLGQRKGSDTVQFPNGEEIELPLCEMSTSVAEYEVPYDTWVIIGSLVDDGPEEGEERPQLDRHICVKVVSPASTK